MHLPDHIPEDPYDCWNTEAMISARSAIANYVRCFCAQNNSQLLPGSIDEIALQHCTGKNVIPYLISARNGVIGIGVHSYIRTCLEEATGEIILSGRQEPANTHSY